MTTSSSPVAGGTTSGGGAATCGTQRTVTATANSGYSFVNWTENGSVVSTSASYQFTVTGNRTLEADFVYAPGSQLELQVNGTSSITIAPSASAAIPIILDFSKAQSGTNLASLSYQVTWNPAHFHVCEPYDGSFGGPLVNTSSVGAGSLSVALFSAVGASSSFTTLTVTLRATGAPVAQSTVTATVTAAGNELGQSILPIVSVRPLNACIGTPAGRRGDADGDGIVSIIDAQQIARYVVGLSVQNAAAVAAAGDANGDGAVDIIDAQQVARFVVGLAASPGIDQPLAGGCP